MVTLNSNYAKGVLQAASVFVLLTASTISYAQLNPEPSVDPFTGAFQCSIPLITVPGPHGSGYTIVLNYSSDVRAEDEASWVGYGWSLEPPKITRNQRGLPDDMRERPVLFRTKGGMSSTTVTLFGAGEIIATPKTPGDFSASLGGGGSLALTFNSLTGFDVTMAASLQGAIGMGDPPIGLGTGVSYDTKGRFGIGLSGGYGGTPSGYAFGSGVSLFMYDPAATIRPTPSLIAPFSGTSITGELSLRIAGYEGGANVSVLTMTMQDRTIYASGFMFSPDAIGSSGNNSIMVDYLVDRERPVTALTASPLPMPLPGYDEFYVSSPSTNGKFRLHHWLPMYARPPDQTSEIDIYALSLKGILPGESIGGGIGGTLPIPVRNTTHTGGIGSFNDGGIAKETQEWTNKRQPFFRFTNEPAEPVRYSPNDGVLHSTSLGVLAKWQYQPVNLGQKPRMNRSIEYKTVGDISKLMSVVSSTSKYQDWLSVCLGGFEIEGTSNGNSVELPNEAICQFSITAEDGSTTEFGAPEYTIQDAFAYLSAKGSNLSVSRDAERIHFPNRMLTYSNFENAAGRDMTFVRASQWNATAIYEPKFIDIKGDGPDVDDVGGWTVFKYTNDHERRWRQPHCGYMLDRRMPQDADDDMLAVAEGRYKPRYWRSVETATHIAYFFTNVNPNLSAVEAGNAQNIGNYTYNERLDACEPSDGDAVGQEGVPHAETNTTPYLARIELWVKGSDGLPETKLKTVHFSYDYSAFPGNPSSKALTAETTPAGKLTLRRIWAEDRDVHESKIYPLDFYYHYPVLSGTSVDERDMIDIGNMGDRYDAVSVPSTLAEDPTFSANDIDAWGYQTGVRSAFSSNVNLEPQRYAPRQVWDADQKDPGAWRLKTIRTSTGERIVPVYESRTYQWVQDHKAMTLAKLDPTSRDISTTTDVGLNWYAVNLNDVGLGSASQPTIDEYVKQFSSRFLDAGEPLYFRFGYDADACGVGTKAFYTRGYAKVTACTTTTLGSDHFLKFQLGSGTDGLNLIGSSTYNVLLDNTKKLPYQSILKYWKTFLRGTCDEPVSGNDPLSWVSRFINVIQSLGWKYSNSLSIPPNVLPTLNTTISCVRIPVAGKKVGCGARVQKLLMLSPDGVLEEGDAAALGTEYVYGEPGEGGAEVLSYGVATDEPFLMREENALVGIDPEKWADASQRVLDEEYMAVSELPLASMLLPPPSVGYSQVLSRSINREATTPGFIVQKFLTAKDVPSISVQAARPSIGPDYYDNPNDLVFRKSELRLGVAQSFAIDVLHAHGLPLSIERYSGADKSDRVLIGSVRYDYLPHKGEAIEFRDFGSSLRVTTNVDIVDIIQETRQITEEMDLWRLDLSGELTWVVPLIGGCVLRTEIDHLVQTSAVVSISEYQPRLWRTIATVDGRADTSDILAWDDQTGLPALTLSRDDFNNRRTNASSQQTGTFHTGTVAAVSKPALKMYPDLGQRSLSYRMRFGGENENPGIGFTTAAVCATGSVCVSRTPSNVTDDECDRGKLLSAAFHYGDVVNISSLAGELQSVVRITSTAMPTCSSAVTLNFDVLHGTPPSQSTPVTIEIVAPGTRNFITSNAATQVVYGEDFKEEIERAHSLKGMEDWLYFCNIGARSGFSGSNFKDFLDANNGSFPFKYDKGGSKIFSPTQAHVTTLEDYIGQDPYPTTPCASCNANSAGLSQFHYAMQRELDDRTVRLGILKPRQAYEIQGCDCGAFRQYWGLENGGTFDCVYHWGWKPGLSLHADNDCFENSWLKFSGFAWPTDYAVDEYDWDLWRRFYVGDKGTLVIGSIRPSLLADNSGGMKFINGNFSSVIPAVSDNAKTLAVTVIPQIKSDFDVDGFDVRQWSPVATWSWETEETDDASGATGQTAVTVFNAAGAFESPGIPAADQSIWTNPLSEEAAPTGVFPRDGWHRSSVIKAINSHGEPITLADAKGIYTVLQYSADGLIPEATFVNAFSGGSGAAWYENFEGGSPTAEAFSGQRSLFIDDAISIGRPSRVEASGQITGKLLVRAWVRPAVSTMSLIGSNLTIAGTVITADHVIASVNGWNLVEVPCSSSVATGFTIQAQNNLEVWVDDVVVHPIKCFTQATVRDREYKPVVQFGADHFPIRRAYDAKGRVALVSSDASSGTVASLTSRVNVPGRVRTLDFMKGGAISDQSGVLPLPLMQGALDSAATTVKHGLNSVLDSMKPHGVSATGSLLEMRATPDSVRTTSVAKPLLDMMRGIRPNSNRQDSTQPKATEPKR